MSTDAAERLEVAQSAAAAGASRALEAFRGTLDVETKADPTDLVTATDRAAQTAVVDAIEERYPEEPVVGEEDEAPTVVPESGAAWIVDPIDGTSNFVRGLRTWTTVVAAVVDGEPVAAAIEAPALGDSYAAGPERATRNGEEIRTSAVEDPAEAVVCPTLSWSSSGAAQAVLARLSDEFGLYRRLGSSQLELALVADGGLDAAVARGPAEPWDTVAGTHLVRTAGGRVTDRDGEPWRHDSESLVATNGHLHDAARSVLAAGAPASSEGAE